MRLTASQHKVESFYVQKVATEVEQGRFFGDISKSIKQLISPVQKAEQGYRYLGVTGSKSYFFTVAYRFEEVLSLVIHSLYIFSASSAESF